MNLSTLNKEQQQAVLYNDGPLLIIAGAGSGKTRCLTYKIAYLIEQGADEKEILAITFTNKAAEEMKERVAGILNNTNNNIFISTFHKFCGRLLRAYIETVGYDRNFVIYDKLDQQKLVSRILSNLLIDEKLLRPKAVLSNISYCKNHGITKEEYMDKAKTDHEKNLAKCFVEYEDRMFKSNAVDFDDMLILAVKILKENKNIRDLLNNRFKYILVDEYQDTNLIQFELISLLREKYKFLTVVGDDDQSIYGFRGADIQNILSFEQVFKDAKVVKLTQNYRSTNNILNIANSIIKNNIDRKTKELWSENGEGIKTVFHEYADDNQEAEQTIREIKKDKDFKNTAILYRTNAQSRRFEDYLRKENIPYVLVGDVSFYERREVKDVVSYLRLAVNKNDNEALFRIINVPKRGIGEASVEKIVSYAKKHNLSIYDALFMSKEIGIKPKTISEIDSFLSLIALIKSKYEINDMIDVIKNEGGYVSFLQAEYGLSEATDRVANIDELKNKSASIREILAENEVDENLKEEYKNLNGMELLAEFLKSITLVEATDTLDEDKNAVTLMSIHMSKGLEFDNVYLVGMNENLFPSAHAIHSDNPKDIEEERRLCYVGITRCKKKLVLSSAASRFMNGTRMFSTRSRFIDEIDTDLIDIKQHLNVFDEQSDPFSNSYGYNKGYGGYRRKSYDNRYDNNDSNYRNEKYGKYNLERKSNYIDIDSIDTNKKEVSFKLDDYKISNKKPNIDFIIGDKVSHVKFGEGIVKNIEETDKDYEVTVLFDNGDEKVLYQAFAKLKRV